MFLIDDRDVYHHTEVSITPPVLPKLPLLAFFLYLHVLKDKHQKYIIA